MFQVGSRFVTILFASLAVLGVLSVPVRASAQGNSDAARLCQNGGHANYVGVTEGVITFLTSAGECVSFAAQGGQLVAVAIVEPCLDGGYTSYTTSSRGEAFASEADCVSFVAQGGTLVPVVLEDPAVTRCREEALVAGFDPNSFNIVAGTDGHDRFGDDVFTDGPDLICGFDGHDYIYPNLYSGDVFLGGDGSDFIYTMLGGTFYGGNGYDHIGYVNILGETVFVRGPQ